MNRVKNIKNQLLPEALQPSYNYHWSNWANSQESYVKEYYQPSNLKQIQALLKRAVETNSKVKVCGASHSPNDIARTTDILVNLDKFNKILFLDKEKKTVKVEGGIRIFELNDILLQNGLALNCLGSISDQSIAGAISTATHGTGIKFGIISTQVIEMDLMLASGEILTLSETSNREVFKAAQCGLGALGIIVHLTIQCESAFNLHILEYPVPLDTLLYEMKQKDFLTKNEHFRIFWTPHTPQCYVWKANRTREAITLSPSSIQSFKDRLIGYHFLQFFYWIGLFFPNVVPIVNRMYQYLTFSTPHAAVKHSFNGFNFDCRFRQELTEWAIPIDKMEEALQTLQKLIVDNDFKVHFPVEIRFVAKDDIYLSPSYEQDTCFIGIIMYRPYNTTPPFQKYFELFEREMYKLGGRPHWGKGIQFKEIKYDQIYPKFNQFRRIREELDPTHLFENAYLSRLFNNGNSH